MSKRDVSLPSDNPGVHVPPPFFWLAGVGVALLLHQWWPLRIGWHTPRLVVAWAFLALFAVLLLWSFGWFLRRKTTLIPNRPSSALIVEGPFRLTRNPLYVAMTLLTIGVGLWLDTWWVLILLPPVIAFVDRHVIAREEAYLRRRFGAEYDRYAAAVRRWI